jgi:uncharacterized protein
VTTKAGCGPRVRFKPTVQSLILNVLRGYKWLVSPLLPPACRYVPSCSEYAIEAVERFGALRGMAMSFWRLCRCHPFVKGGYDPVAGSHISEVRSGGVPGLQSFKS